MCTRPIITASDCEGAGEMFRVTALKGNIDEKPQADFFGKPTYLTVSGQLEGETFACALSNIYTFGPTFRAENSNTARHAAEFWMIEPEMAFCDLQGDMDLGEEFIKAMARYALEHCAEDLALFAKFVDKGLHERLKFVVERPFVRVPYTEAVEILKKSGKQFEFPVEYGLNLQSEHERFLTEEHFKSPATVFNYPREIKPFYMRLNDDGKTVTAMDVLVPGIGEVIGGAQREERLGPTAREHEVPQAQARGLLVVCGLAALRHGAARRVRPGLRAAADVPDRRAEYPRRDPLRPHARQCGV